MENKEDELNLVRYLETLRKQTKENRRKGSNEYYEQIAGDERKAVVSKNKCFIVGKDGGKGEKRPEEKTKTMEQ
jgi:hypothetical protein